MKYQLREGFYPTLLTKNATMERIKRIGKKGKDMRKGRYTKWMGLLTGVMCSIGAWATDVNSASALKSALGSATVSGNTVTLTGNVSLGSTLSFTGGTIVLDLNGKTITYDRTGTKETAVGIRVSGGNISIKNGTIEVRAAKGNKGTLAAPIHYDGYDGYDAVCIQWEGGEVSLMNNVVLVAKPGEGGDPYSGRFIKGNKGSYGGAYTIDPPSAGTVSDMLPGAYIVGASSSDYSSTGYPGTKTGSFTTTVKLTNYTAKFTVDGVSLSSSSYTIDGSFAFPEYSKKGYKLSDWSPSPSGIKYVGTTPVITGNHNTSATITFSATTSLIEYTVSYDLQSGTNASGNPAKYSINSGSVTLGDPTRRGYDFKGWRNNDKVVTALDYDEVAQEAVNNVYTLTAQWDVHNYKVTFDVNVDGRKESTFTLNTASLPEPDADAVPKGKTFDGWYLKGTATKVELPLTDLKNIEVEAHWKDKTYYATFYDGDTEVNKEPFTVSSGLASFSNPQAKDGYVFEYWTDAKTGGTKVTSIAKGETGDRSYYAFWTPVVYTLTYNLNGGTYSGKNPVTYTYAERAALLTEQDISFAGYKFKGWLLGSETLTQAPVTGGTASDGGRKVAFSVSASWEVIDYAIVFRENGGTAVESRSYSVERGISESEMPTTTRTGYTFLGWFIGEKKYTSVAAGSGELTLDAKWEPVVYTIEYKLNGGTNPDGSPSSYTYEQAVTLPKPTKENYGFAGWFTDEALTASVSEIPANTTGDKVFYAKWLPKTYTLTFDANGGKISGTAQTYEYGTAAEFARKPYRDNYDFAGWYYDKECTKAYGDKIETTSSGDHTLYAKWTPSKYTITYDTYYGTIVSEYATTYTIEDDVTLPTVVTRDGFSFAGWYADDQLTIKATKIEKGSSGNKTFYATWDRGYQVLFSQPSYGKISVTWKGRSLTAGTLVGRGDTLTVTAVAESGYELQSLTIDGTTYTAGEQKVVMPEKDLKIAAVFAMAYVPSASAPEIILTPSGVNKFPKGEPVKVELRKTDDATTLYYSLDGSPEKAYTGVFLVESAEDSVFLEAIARKDGCADGVKSQYIVFDNWKITLTFDLPLGVSAVNPEGGDVATATTTGGSFEFALTVDEDYYTNIDSMTVLANDSVIKPDASGLYTLANCATDIVVTVSGLHARTCTLTLQQTANGQITFTDASSEATAEVQYGSTVSVTATADEDYRFLEWSTGSQSNPLRLTVRSDTTISARFISDYKSYMITLPQMEGVTVKPFTGYSTEVKKDESFKFYLSISSGYHEENLRVSADGEELTKNNGGYALYHVNKNISVSVEGIVRDSMKLTLPEHVTAKVVETMTDLGTQGVFGETMLLLHAAAPEGKVFSKWNDGKTDNPRTATAVDAAQLIPLFVDDDNADGYAKVNIIQSGGAAVTGVGANMDAVKSGDVVQLKVTLLPAYSESAVALTADGVAVSPTTSLRSSSETKTYLYYLTVEKDTVTVRLSGLVRNTYSVTVTQNVGGEVSSAPVGMVSHGTEVHLTAKADPGMTFVKWWDGNTLNPYPYTITADTEVKAYFVGATSAVANERVDAERTRITAVGSTLVVETAEDAALYVWDYKGSLVRTATLRAGVFTCQLPSGAYAVKAGGSRSVKVVIR